MFGCLRRIAWSIALFHLLYRCEVAAKMSCYAKMLKQNVYKGLCGDLEYEEPEGEVLKKVSSLARVIRGSGRVLIHTGAGISTACGVPDFRGPQGVWTLEHKGLVNDKAVSFEEAVPSFAHRAIVALMRAGIVQHVVTQNVDGLHLRSGVPRSKLSEIHGSAFAELCEDCGVEVVRDWEVGSIGLKKTGNSCEACGGDLRDRLCDWDSILPEDEMERAIEEHKKADLVIVLGSSLRIRPAGNFPMRTKRKNGKAQEGKIVIVNLQKTHLDKNCDLRFFARIDLVMKHLMKELGIEVLECQQMNKEKTRGTEC